MRQNGYYTTDYEIYGGCRFLKLDLVLLLQIRAFGGKRREGLGEENQDPLSRGEKDSPGYLQDSFC